MRHWTLMRLGRLAMRGMMMCRLFLGHRARRRSRRIGRRNVERRRGATSRKMGGAKKSSRGVAQVRGCRELVVSVRLRLQASEL